MADYALPVAAERVIERNRSGLCETEYVHLLGRLGLAQRIVVVVSLGLALGAVGTYIVNLGGSAGNFGWFGYAPLTRTITTLGPDLSTWEQMLVWLGLIAVWMLASILLLRTRPTYDGGSH